MITVFHELDVYITVGNVAMVKGLGYAQAITGEENVLEATGLFHPVIDKAVANDVTSINVSDNLNRGYSHFYAEVLRVKTVAAAVGAGQKLLVIFDELFKGTNVKDAFDATLAVTTALATYDDCCFIISTHIIEVGEVLRSQSGRVQLQYLPTVMNGARPAYTYALKAGISSDRHGMMILENEGIFELLAE